jgi:hypothetical protein
MSSVGPQLPPHILAKRKRELEEEEKDGGAVGKTQTPPSCSDGLEKRRRVIGPSLPPASLDELPPGKPTTLDAEEGDSDTDSSSDGEFGPALPSGPGEAVNHLYFKKCIGRF